MGLGGSKLALGEDISNRRGAIRTKTLLSGKAIVGDALFSADCIILDLSETGARVRVPPDARLGPPLYLLFLRNGRVVEAAAAWRRGEEAGLVFTAEHDMETDRSPDRRRIRALWEAVRPDRGTGSSF